MSSEYQELLEKLLNSDTTDVIPQSRAEYIMLTAINSLGIDTLPEPGSRMEAYLMALITKMGEGGSASQVQPDWNQNDSNSADYVKNRTHYEESTYVDYVLNTSNTFIVGLSMPEVGETMTVKVNGVESAETVKEAESSILGFSYKYIGNIDIDSLINGGTGWCVAYAQESAVGSANPDTTITVETLVVHKIDDKFINFDGFVRTFDYHFKDTTLYKLLYNDDGSTCVLYTCNNFILPEPNSQLFGCMGEIGFSKVYSIRINSCFVTGFIINPESNSITTINVVLGTDTGEMENIAAGYGYVHTTNPNA